MKNILLLVLVAFNAGLASGSPVKREGFNWEPVRQWAIQDRGRVKPFDTFARESALLVTGKTSWKGMAAVEMVWSWLVNLDKEWADEEFVRVDFEPLKRELGLDVHRQYFKISEVRDLDGLQKLIRVASAKGSRREKLSELEKKGMEVQNKLGLLDSIVGGSAMAILPNPTDEKGEWFTLGALAERSQLPYASDATEKFAEAFKVLVDSYLNQNPSAWYDGAYQVKRMLVSLSGGHYPSETSIDREIMYNHLRPFRWAWVLYAFAFVCLVSFIVGQKKKNARWFRYASFGFLFGAFALHAFGFVLRCMISGRPPVTNMYESVIWVTWGCMLFSILIWAAYRNVIVPTAASVFAIAGLVLADNLPFILDPEIHPLVPVLRSNFWLTIHVLTITLSYAAFAVSLCIGNVNLGIYIFKPHNKEAVQENILYMYRAMQIGVVLLAAGTILGGWWADYSWGRFWGWDPKEVWALIALLLYIAVLHGRFTGWLKGFGFVATTVSAFLGVLMAWYGVNFVLGVGLHSYGFGAGGLSYMVFYLLVQVGIMVFAWVRYSQAGKPGNNYVVPRTGI